eukprot:scaffold303586_cov19-Tisochrysis_lutea.AAC.1
MLQGKYEMSDDAHLMVRVVHIHIFGPGALALQFLYLREVNMQTHICSTSPFLSVNLAWLFVECNKLKAVSADNRKWKGTTSRNPDKRRHS